MKSLQRCLHSPYGCAAASGYKSKNIDFLKFAAVNIYSLLSQIIDYGFHLSIYVIHFNGISAYYNTSYVFQLSIELLQESLVKHIPISIKSLDREVSHT